MERIVNAKQLRSSLPRIVEGVRRGERYTVIYRSRPAFRIVPARDEDIADGELADDPIYGAAAVGASKDRRSSADHDALLYGRE